MLHVKDHCLSPEECISVVRAQDIQITFCEWFDGASNIWCFESHNHPSVIEMIYFRSGDANIEISSEILSISLYDVVIYPEGAYHKEALSPTVYQEVICIRVKVEGGLPFNRPIHLSDQNQLLGALFRKTYEEYKKADTGDYLSKDYAKLLLLTCIAMHIESSNTRGFLDVVLEYLADHYCENIYIPQLSQMVHVSEAHLNKCFKKRMGTPIIKYVNSLRMEMAKHMLIASFFSVEHIATTVGFSSPKYFCRAFKSYTQLSPSAFRHEKGKGRALSPSPAPLLQRSIEEK